MNQPHPKVLRVLSPPCDGKGLFGKDAASTSSGSFVCCGRGRFICSNIRQGDTARPGRLVCGDKEEERKYVSVRQKLVGTASVAKIRSST